MCSNIKDNENIRFSNSMLKRSSNAYQTSRILSLMLGFAGLLAFMSNPVAIAQLNTMTGDSSLGLDKNVGADTENTLSSEINNSSGTNATSDSGTGIRNLSLQSFSSFVDEINSKVRSESSGNSSVSNMTSSTPASSSISNQSLDQRSSPSKLLNLKEIVIQNTTMSIPAPVRHPGQPTHEVVFALPLRNDGHIWTGTVTFTASKPIEVEVLHTYAPSTIPDSVHGEPYYAVLPGNNSIAITHLRHIVDVPIEINGTGISSGTLNFAGNALVFHKTTGEPFTVTYTIDAVSKELTKLDRDN
jgi:hypothetical protein